METYLIYLGGIFVPSDQELEVHAPYDNVLIAKTYKANAIMIERAIAAANKAQAFLKEMSSYERAIILTKIATGITNERERLARVLSMECGKPLRYALAEIDRAAQTFAVAAEETKRLPKEYISLDWTLQGKGKEGLVKYFPIGNVAGIAPFNFPMNLVAHKVAPAIASACPIVLKPASTTPLSALELARIIDRTDLPKGAVSVLPMDREIGNKLVEHHGFQLLSFTGSPEVGWKMKAQAGKKKVVLELGGNAGVIITPSAQLEQAVDRCIIGGFAYSGQVCIHAQRIFVQEKQFSSFVEQFVVKAQQLKYGPPQEAETEFSSMIDENNALRVERWVNEALDAGAKLLCGGKRNGGFYEPTVLTNTTTEMKVNCEEVFGPVVIVEPYSTIEDAVRLINSGRFGLQTGLFSDSQSEIDYCFNTIEVGGLIVNDVPSFRVDHMPYGGIKDSGLGREGVKYAILDMMEPRILVK